MSVQELIVKEKRIGNIQDNVIKVEILNEELLNMIFTASESVPVESFLIAGHPRALLKDQVPLDFEQVTGLEESLKLNIQLMVTNENPVTKCFRCTEKELITLLTPNGKRCFLYHEERKVYLVFILKCRPSHHSCQSFKLRLELVHSGTNVTYSTDVELVTRKRKNTEALLSEQSAAAANDSPQQSASVPKQIKEESLPSPKKRANDMETVIRTKRQATIKTETNTPPAPTSPTVVVPLTTATDFKAPLTEVTPPFHDYKAWPMNDAAKMTGNFYAAPAQSYTPFYEKNHVMGYGSAPQDFYYGNQFPQVLGFSQMNQTLSSSYSSALQNQQNNSISYNFDPNFTNNLPTNYFYPDWMFNFPFDPSNPGNL